jgi:hypothetical protein
MKRLVYKRPGISSLAELLLAYRELRFKQFGVQQKFRNFGYGRTPHSNSMLVAHKRDAKCRVYDVAGIMAQ